MSTVSLFVPSKVYKSSNWMEFKQLSKSLFEEMEEQIINERKGQLAQQQFIDMADELANLVVEQPDDLQEASAAFDLEIKQTGRLTPSSTAEIFSFPKNFRHLHFQMKF